MSTSQIPTPQPDDEWSIDLLDIVNFLVAQWQRLLMGGLAGLLLALASWFSLGQYTAESVLINNQVESQTKAIDLISWRAMTRSLPGLASQLVSDGQVGAEQTSQMERMSNSEWWAKNVKPTFSLSKADTKELAALSKQMQEAGGADILNLVIQTTGKTQQEAAARGLVATNFITQGSAYLSVKETISGYESKVLTVNSNLQKKITDTEIELNFLRQRAEALEVLRQRFPANTPVANQQLVDLKDTNAKFMPISTQIVAVQSDINATLEQLQRMRDQLAQSELMRSFVQKAQQQNGQKQNGFELITALLQITSELRSTAKPDDMNAQVVLSNMEADLVKTRTFYSKGLEVRLTPTVKAPSLAMPLALGLMAGTLLMLVFLLLRTGLANLRAKKANA
ncbi:hypothetical protein [Limnohabitans sp. 2KL-51]|uniref:hypothetical protein n=1 Tax=Limnohabitans sp. 2KL-51 TaxID=1977911 RepID=UPI000D3C3B44|nr:hypothetical protein [Limnohabitans sp. 2KL-51]PUE51341.1 hypothetical protein B9Z49_04525 [Limnohabitans sp. 2KL-51]